MALRKTVAGRQRESGQSVIEFTLLSPWILLLFMGIFNLGFYCYALISVENAARVAALRLSADGEKVAVSETIACNYVRNEMRMLPNLQWVPADTTCGPGDPVQVQAVKVEPSEAPNPDGVAPTVLVTVTYQTIPLFPIPGLTGRLSVTRTVQMRKG